MARVNRENKPDSSSSARNQYGNRSSLLESDRSRHINRDHSRFNGDITLAKREKYSSRIITANFKNSGRFVMKNTDTESSSDNKYLNSYNYGELSQKASSLQEQLAQSTSADKYSAAQKREAEEKKDSVQRQLSENKNSVRESKKQEQERRQKAAAIQEQLIRITSVSAYAQNLQKQRKNTKNTDNDNTENRSNPQNKYFSGERGEYNPENIKDRAKAEKVSRYFEYRQNKAVYKYQKKLYKVYKIKSIQNKPSALSRINNIALISRTVTDPIRNGNTIKAIAIPATLAIEYIMRKHKGGQFLIREKRKLDKTSEATKNSDDIGTAMYSGAMTYTSETVKDGVMKAANSAYQSFKQNKYMKYEARQINKANKYLAKQTEKNEAMLEKIYSGNAEKKTLDKIEKFAERNTENRSNRYLMKKIDKTEKKSLKEQNTKKQKAKSYKKATSAAKAAEERKVKAGIFKENTKAFAGKAFHAVKSQTLKIVGAGGSAVVAPILLIIIIITLIALLFSWQNAFKIQLSDREITAETEEEILDGYMQMIYDFMQTAEYRCFLTYGNYCDAQYDWEDAELSFDDYYNEVLLPLIEQEKAKITAAYGPAIASASPSDRGAIIAKMSQEISEFVNATLEKGKEEFDEILQQLNDYLREPTSFPPSIWKYDPDPNKAGNLIDDSFYIAETYTQCELASLTDPEGDGNDAAQYAGQQICSNDFDLGSLKFDTELTAEDIFPYIALSRVISIMNDGNNSNDEDESEPAANISGEITADEINAFFQKTEFICIDAHLTGYDCGMCRRKLVGDWETGWKWQYYCRETTDTYHHQILSGSISVKEEKDLLDAVMTAYGAEEAGLSEDDCLSLVNTYREYVKDTLGNTEHPIGKNDYALAEFYYLSSLRGYGPPSSPWNFNTPLETDEDEKGEEISEATK